MKVGNTEKQTDTDSPAETLTEQGSAEHIITTPLAQKNRLQLKKAQWIVGLIILLALTAGVGWLAAMRLSENTAAEKVNTTVERARLPVRVVKARLQPIQSLLFSDGYASAVRGKHLPFEVAGTITYIKKIDGRDLREGDLVRSGEVLAKVDDRKLVADLIQAQAADAEAKQQTAVAVASLEQARANLAQAKANHKKAQSDKEFTDSELKRHQELFEHGVISKSQLDVKKNQFQNAVAAIDAAQAQIKAAADAIASAQAQVDAAKAGIDSARGRVAKAHVTLEDTIIKAPFNGVIAHLNIREGDYWTPQLVQLGTNYQSVVDSVPIIIIDPKEFEVNLELPAFDGTRVHTGQTAYIVLDEDLSAASVSGMTREALFRLSRARGKVFSVSPAVTPGGRAVRVTVRISEGTSNLRDGARVSAWIVVEENQQAVVAPFNAFVFRDQKPHVFVVNQKKGVVEQRQIQIGIEGLSQQEIRNGVKAGDLLVIDGQNRLVNGAPVEVVDELK